MSTHVGSAKVQKAPWIKGYRGHARHHRKRVPVTGHSVFVTWIVPARLLTYARATSMQCSESSFLANPLSTGSLNCGFLKLSRLLLRTVEAPKGFLIPITTTGNV